MSPWRAHVFHSPVLAVLLYLTLGCSTPQEPLGGTIDVTVTHLAEQDAWKVLFELPFTTEEVPFARQEALFRADSWEILTEGVHLERRDGREWLVADAGNRFDTVRLLVPSYYDLIRGDYELNVAFTDGSVLLYSGHFELAVPDSLADRVRWTFKAAETEDVVLQGLLHDREGRSDRVDPNGTYVFFGNTSPVHTPVGLAVLDSELPEWIRQRLDILLPQLFELYASRFDLELPVRPTLFFSHVRGQPDERWLSGGALPSLLQMAAIGEAWGTEDPESLFDVMQFIAHESAHLWNGQAVSHPGTAKSAWMHEGGAHALSLRALQEIGILDEQQVLDRRLESANVCLQELSASAGISLDAQPAEGRTRGQYHCGATIGWIAEAAALGSSDGSRDLFTFWRSVLHEGNASPEVGYTEAIFLQTLANDSERHDVVEGIRRFVHEPLEEPAVFVAELLQSVGIPVRSVEDRLVVASQDAG